MKVGLNEISMFQVCFVDLYHKLHLTVNLPTLSYMTL